MAERIMGRRWLLAVPFAFMLALCALLLSSAIAPTAAYAENPEVHYIDADGMTKTVIDYQYLTEATITENGNQIAPGWWVVNDAFTHDQDLIVGKGGEGVHLVLPDGSKLVVTGGIRVPEDGSLTIYAGSSNEDITGTGALEANGDSTNAAGIGPFEKNKVNGAITINGGVITAKGYEGGAGIGGFQGPGENITINGGTVNATGSNGGAGIGGAGGSEDLPSGVTSNGEHITINGGTVNATGGLGGAGIGGGKRCGCGNYITINGGDITATGNNGGAGIGGGGGIYSSDGGGSASNITINGGTIEATGSSASSFSAGIGAGQYGISPTNVTVTESILYEIRHAQTPYELGNPESVVAPGDRTTTFSKGSYVFFSMKKSAVQIITAPVAIPDLIFTGSEQAGVNMDSQAPYTLTSGKVSATDAGDYSATFELDDTENYAWTDESTDPVTVTWSIAPVKAGTPDSTVAISDIPDQTWTGSAAQPKPTITFNGTDLKEGVDYDLSYSNNKAPGTATVTVTFKGNFEGEQAVEFKIVDQSSKKDDDKSSTTGKDKSTFPYTGDSPLTVAALIAMASAGICVLALRRRRS